MTRRFSESRSATRRETTLGDRFGASVPKSAASASWKLSAAQKTFIVKQGEEGMLVAEICRKARISQATDFNWKKYAGLLPTLIARPWARTYVM